MQLTLFECEDESRKTAISSTFADNTKLPVHRWFRYSAGFSGQWAENLIRAEGEKGLKSVLDPFAGSATTLLCAENVGVVSSGVESHPFVARIARAKLARRSDPESFRSFAHRMLADAKRRQPNIVDYPKLVRKCFHDEVLGDLDCLRRTWADHADDSPASKLSWLALAGILRRVSHVGTAQWQYVLPNKSKKNVLEPFSALEEQIRTMHRDMVRSQNVVGPTARLLQSDARTCDGVSDETIDLVVTSPPYPNNFDYADATRLEMSFFQEIRGWGDLQESVRKFLVRSCSQHVPERQVDFESTLNEPELAPIADEIRDVCHQLAEVRLSKGGKKTYHLMVACYFLDLAKTWHALRRVCRSPSKVCFVIGDSAPYGVYVPVMKWLGNLALAAGFRSQHFEKTRDRNVKWKNRKHRVPLCEGRLWVDG